MAGKVKGSGRRRREGVMEEITGHFNFVIYFLQEKIPQEKNLARLLLRPLSVQRCGGRVHVCVPARVKVPCDSE